MTGELRDEDFSDGPRSDCGQPDQLYRSGLLNQPLCPTCIVFHQLAPGTLQELKKRGHRVVEVEGIRIRLRRKGAVLLVARAMVRKHRREEAEAQAALASSQAEA